MKHRSAEAMARRAEKRGTTVEEQKKIDFVQILHFKLDFKYPWKVSLSKNDFL